jgi:hypothetical protein
MIIHVYSNTVTTQVIIRGGINMSKGILQINENKKLLART